MNLAEALATATPRTVKLSSYPFSCLVGIELPGDTYGAIGVIYREAMAHDWGADAFGKSSRHATREEAIAWILAINRQYYGVEV